MQLTLNNSDITANKAEQLTLVPNHFAKKMQSTIRTQKKLAAFQIFPIYHVYENINLYCKMCNFSIFSGNFSKVTLNIKVRMRSTDRSRNEGKI